MYIPGGRPPAETTNLDDVRAVGDAYPDHELADELSDYRLPPGIFG